MVNIQINLMFKILIILQDILFDKVEIEAEFWFFFENFLDFLTGKNLQVL